MKLAIFDLDNTLLDGDSDHAWGEFLIDSALADRESHRRNNDRFYQDYEKGVLDIQEYVRFTMSPVLSFNQQELARLHLQFMESRVRSMILPAARELVQSHKTAGDYCLIMSATNEFITGPIADAFSVDALLSTRLQRNGEFFTGEISGVPCFQQGKVTRLEQWLQTRKNGFTLDKATFYSDSANDLPLLCKVGTPVAVDPDPALELYAKDHKWQILSLR